jgi:hypothetical protein
VILDMGEYETPGLDVKGVQASSPRTSLGADPRAGTPAAGPAVAAQQQQQLATPAEAVEAAFAAAAAAAAAAEAAVVGPGTAEGGGNVNWGVAARATPPATPRAAPGLSAAAPVRPPQRLQLYAAYAPPLAPRAAVWGAGLALPGGVWRQTGRGFFDAPGAGVALLQALPNELAEQLPPEVRSPAVTIVFVGADGGRAVMGGLAEPEARASAHLLRLVLRAALDAVAGAYLCREQEGDLKYMVAFPSAAGALKWCLLVQDTLLLAPWPAALLALPPCAERRIEGGPLLFRGPRLKMGVCEGLPRSVVPDCAGRADFHGESINAAARYMDAAAHGGQVVCEAALVERVFRCVGVCGADAVGRVGRRAEALGSAVQRRVRDRPQGGGAGCRVQAPATLPLRGQGRSPGGRANPKHHPLIAQLPQPLGLPPPPATLAPFFPYSDWNSQLGDVAEEDVMVPLSGRSFAGPQASGALASIESTGRGAAGAAATAAPAPASSATAAPPQQAAAATPGGMPAGHSGPLVSDSSNTSARLLLCAQQRGPAPVRGGAAGRAAWQLRAQPRLPTRDTPVQALHLGSYAFKGSARLVDMVSVSSARLAARAVLLPRDAPRGKGRRVLERGGVAAGTRVLLPDLLGGGGSGGSGAAAASAAPAAGGYLLEAFLQAAAALHAAGVRVAAAPPASGPAPGSADGADSGAAGEDVGYAAWLACELAARS